MIRLRGKERRKHLERSRKKEQTGYRGDKEGGNFRRGESLKGGRGRG